MRINVSKGDKVLRICPPSDLWSSHLFWGTVTDVKRDRWNRVYEITCRVMVDVPTTMKFDGYGKSIKQNDYFIIPLRDVQSLMNYYLKGE